MNRRNNSLIKTKYILISMVLVLWASSFGGIFGHNNPALNIEKTPVYKVCDLSVVYNSLRANYDETTSQYDNRPIVSALIVDHADSKDFSGHSGDCSGIKISTDKKNVKLYSQGNTLTIYGKLNIGKSKGLPTLTIKADYIDTKGIDTNSDYYIMTEPGKPKAYSKSNTELCNLNDNHIQYRVPSSWQSVKCTDEGKKELFHNDILQNSECYFLNELTGKKNPEFFVVFYFDFNHFVKYSNEKNNLTSIETAIIQNICPKEKSVGVRKILFNDIITYKEKKIVYYVSDYDSCKVEFIFNELKDGVCVMMYVTDGEYAYKEDALYIQETLTVNK